MPTSQMTKMHITFNIKGTVHFEFIAQGQIGSQAFYMEELEELHEALHRKRPELWPNDWILHHDSAPAHKVLSSSFWPKNRLLKLNTHPIPPIWL
jgi:alpha-L-fucosidase